jgi:hypothetical protein
VTQDDLTPWQDTPLVQALTAPGAAPELAGEMSALAAFQSSAVGRRGRRGVVRFLGTGMTSVALLGALGGGVAAAAYTKSFPDSVQSFFHDVLGPIGVPAPAAEAAGPHGSHHKHTSQADRAHPRLTPVAGAPTSSLSPAPGTPAGKTNSGGTTGGRHAGDAGTPAGSTGGQAQRPPAGSTGQDSGPVAQPSVTPTPTATQPPSPTPSPTPTGPAGDPSTWSISDSLSRHVVHVGHGVQVSGTLVDAAGHPVPDHRIAFRVLVAGGAGWQVAAVRRTASDGTVHVWLGNLSRNETVTLGAGNQVHTGPQKILVLPLLSVSVAQSADGTGYVVTVSANGGEQGDVVNLFKHTPNGWQRVGQSSLDGSSSVSFAVPAPKMKKAFQVRLPATKLHGYAQAAFSLQPLS